MDADAKEDAECILELLSDAGMQAVMLDDSAPGVLEGVFEVRVPTADAARAEELIAENPPPEEAEELDTSSELDLETIARAQTEMEAASMKNFLDSNGIPAVLVGDSVLPILAFEVRVAHDQAAAARELVMLAQQSAQRDAPPDSET
jgi:hypothetical protein